LQKRKIKMELKKAICSFIYYKLLGWKTQGAIPNYDKYIVCCAPHTSNSDLLMGKLFYAAMGCKTGFMMKSTWFIGPLGFFFRKMGGVPVYRKRKTTLIDQMVERANQSKVFHLAITPEGTRKANPNWKKGFYQIALKAGLPILLIAIDYQKKCIYCEKVIHPKGDVAEDMKEIKNYFKDFKGKHPENFAI